MASNTLGPPPGRLFDIGGHRLHLRSMGTQHGAPTVVLETGATGYSGAWAWVQGAVASFARVVSYDRAGLGWSEPSGRRHDAVEIARQLHELLRIADVPRPYILVGHSLGGVFVRVFAHEYPQEIAGMVLVDAANPRQLELPNFRDLVSQTRALFTSELWNNPDLARMVIEQSTIGLPVEQTAEAATLFGSPRHVTSAAAELIDIDATMTQGRRVESFGSLPLTVLTAGSVPPEMAGWLSLQSELVGLSSRATQQIVPDAAHLTLVTDERYAAFVIAAIRRLVRDVRVETQS